jgi:uncharacterized protein YndB with AHSA1/START domain
VIDERGRVVHDAHFDHPVERVWRALTDAGEISEWLMATDFVPEAGRAFHLDAGPPRGVIDAEVLAVEDPHRLQCRWMLDGAATVVTITLRGDGSGTHLHLVHEQLPVDRRPDFDRGWVEKFDAMATLLKGAP